MNCFNARNDFVSLWQKTLSPSRRAELLSHLQGCPSCDRSFQAFALTAPVLYSLSEPDSELEPTRSGNHRQPRSLGDLSMTHFPLLSSRLSHLVSALVVAAAAVLAVYFAVPSRTTFEDVIASDNVNAEISSYPVMDGLLAQESATPVIITTSTEVTDNYH